MEAWVNEHINEDIYVFPSGEDELRERLEISEERIRGLELDLSPRAEAYFREAGGFICRCLDGKVGPSAPLSEEDYLYRDRAEKQLGESLGAMLSSWYMELTGILACLQEDDRPGMLRLMETFIQIYNEFETAYSELGTLPKDSQIKAVIYSYLHDYCDDIFMGYKNWLKMEEPGHGQAEKKDQRHERNRAYGFLGNVSSMLIRGVFGTEPLCREYGRYTSMDHGFSDLLMEHDRDLSLFLGDRLRSRIYSSEAYRLCLSRSHAAPGTAAERYAESGSHGERLLFSIRSDVAKAFKERES